jgi:outer membrane protein assembly factor BamB
VTWSDERNIVWKLRLPGPGTSSPIVWGNHVYVTCYSGYGLSEEAPGSQRDLKRHLVSVDRESGRIEWTADMENRAPVTGYDGYQALHGYASSTPVADESGIYVFNGSSGAAAYTHEGKLRWHRSLGAGTNPWGTSASPLLFEDLVMFQADIESQSLVALNKNSGEKVWSVSTGEPDTWSTPCLAEVKGRHELIFHHTQGDPTARLMSVNPRNGSTWWECRVLKDYLCPSPIVVDDVCYTLAYQRGAAIRLGGERDVTGTHVLWKMNKGTETCTPIYHDGYLYWAHQENGIVYCVNAQTGAVVYEERLLPHPGRLYASGVMADGKIYYVSREKGAYVVAAGTRYRLLAHNTIGSDDSVFNATPAISRGKLLIRSRKYLYCIGEMR